MARSVEVKDFYPISLVSGGKSKVLANRLSEVMVKIILKSQMPLLRENKFLTQTSLLMNAWTIESVLVP